MAENNIGSIYTLIDIMRRADPSNANNLLYVAEVLSRENPIVKEAPIIEANQALQHMGSRRTSLPTVQKRAINDGVPKSTGKTVPVTAPMSLFETMSQVDEEALRIAPNAVQFRQGEDAAFIEAMAQSVADEIFYGSIGDDVLGFNGLATMFNSSTARPNGDSTWPYNVQLGGGSGADTTSIWAIEWGTRKVHLIYPKGTQAGLEYYDGGKQLVSGVTASTQFYAFISQFKWRCGLYVQDERCIGRIANIETAGSTNIFDDDQLIVALNRLPKMGRDPLTRIYVNRTLISQMEIRVKDKNNVNYSMDNAFGGQMLRFKGVPVQVCDAILDTETAIT